MSDSEIFVVILLVLASLLVLGYYIYRKRGEGLDEQGGEQVWHKKNERLLWEIQFGYNDIVSESRSFLEQARILQATIGKKLHELGTLKKEKAMMFNRNSDAIDQLSDEYSRLTHNLHLLLKEESGITSPELLHSHRLKQFGIILQLSTLSKQIQSLLRENISIVILS